MQFRLLPAIALLLFCLPTSAQQPQTQAEDRNMESLLPNQRAFLNLSDEERTQFIKHFQEANRLFAQKRVFECLEATAEAHEVFPDSPEVQNLRGSCFVEIRAFDKALAAFRKADQLSSNSNSVLFNIGEVYFVTKQWKQAADTFERLIQALPKDDMGLGRLAEYKIMLCKIKLGDIHEAKIMAEKYDYLDDSPYYYFAQAAINYQANELLEAERWLARAARIFRDRNILAPWHDTLVEFGYIKSFYGSDESAESAAP